MNFWRFIQIYNEVKRIVKYFADLVDPIYLFSGVWTDFYTCDLTISEVFDFFFIKKAIDFSQNLIIKNLTGLLFLSVANGNFKEVKSGKKIRDLEDLRDIA